MHKWAFAVYQPSSPNSFVNLSCTSRSFLLTVGLCLARTFSKSALEIDGGRIYSQATHLSNSTEASLTPYCGGNGIILTFAARPLDASSCMVVCTAPGCFGPQGIHMSPSALKKNMASCVLRTGSNSTSFTCWKKNNVEKKQESDSITWIHGTSTDTCEGCGNYLHKQQYPNQKTHLFDEPSSQNHFHLSCAVYPQDGPEQLKVPSFKQRLGQQTMTTFLKLCCTNIS